uniref:Putative transposase protein n=1 Tax=Ixodes ricinus TaxID=34613 RepID=A0A6B0UQ01_IXORI
MGIAAVSQESSNVAHRDGPAHLHILQAVQPQPAKEPLQLSRDATFVLGRLKVSKVHQRLPTLQLSATVYVEGYVARIVAEKMACENCCAISKKPMSNEPMQQLTRYQDHGGLMYPSDDLMHVLDTLR